MKKLNTDGFTITEVIIASGLAVFVSLIAVQQLQQATQLSQNSISIGGFEMSKDTLREVIDYAFRRSESVAFTPLLPNSIPTKQPEDPTDQALNSYKISGNGAIALSSDLRICGNDVFTFNQSPTVPPTDQVILLCCDFATLIGSSIKMPGVVASKPVADLFPDGLPCKQKNGLSISFRGSKSLPLCISEIQEMNVQLAGIINDKKIDRNNTEFYSIDLVSQLGAGASVKQRLELMEFINYPPTDCHETIPRIRGFVQK